ncbi:hypothetical protein [Vibrio parahaemolyticus]|uniref:hypothetical protein n=1 Tax=Vibrio parahaemolyticus TaxID=670 RepID=UPI001E546C5B|nr:hypothetical protein [Vibrio parahaemolyticus]
MAKLKARGAISIASSTEQKNEKPQAFTTVKKKITTSYKVPPLTLRMSLKDKESIAGWVDDLQKLSERNVSAAKLFRALALYIDNIDDDELIKLIDKMN